MFKSPAPPTPPPPIPPEPPPARTDALVVQNEQRAAASRKRGRAATLLTGNQGDMTAPMTSAAQLLGRPG